MPLPTLYGDIDGDLTGKAHGKHQILALDDGIGGIAFGDAFRMG